jgi:hypothetical protein
MVLEPVPRRHQTISIGMPRGKVRPPVEKQRLRNGLRPRLSLAPGLRTLFKTSKHPGTAEKSLDGRQFESTISYLQGDCPLEDGQMGDPR